jgi:retron-type reverse transcriptase
VDGQSIEDFEADLKNNLYKIWNRMSSGTYFPPPVRAVEIPKPHGGGTRMLGIPTVADRIAQTVVALQLMPRTESIFHDDSYGYRPKRSPLDAVRVTGKVVFAAQVPFGRWGHLARGLARGEGCAGGGGCDGPTPVTVRS